MSYTSTVKIATTQQGYRAFLDHVSANNPYINHSHRPADFEVRYANDGSRETILFGWDWIDWCPACECNSEHVQELDNAIGSLIDKDYPISFMRIGEIWDDGALDMETRQNHIDRLCVGLGVKVDLDVWEN